MERRPNRAEPPGARPTSLAAVLDGCTRGVHELTSLMSSESDHPAHLTDALLDAVALFESLDVGYAVVGGLAAMYYGRARFTLDVDLVAASGHEHVLAAHPTVMSAHRFDPAVTCKL